jgi:hypothetical protein
MGSTELEECNVCAPSACQHGTCSLTRTQEPVCDCNFGYRGPACTENSLIAIFVPIFVVVPLVLLLVFTLRFFYLKYHKSNTYLELEQKLLEETRLELASLQRAFTVEKSDITLIRRLDEGAFGTVWLGDYHNDRQVCC